MTARSAALRAAPLLGIGAVLLVWQTLSLGYPPFILPGPVLVFNRFVSGLASGVLLRHAAVTLAEALPGLLIGAALGLIVGIVATRSAWVGRALAPLIVASQGVPFVAVAPLIFLWFGSGPLAKIIVCAVIVFFPIAVNVMAGLRAIPTQWRELFAAHAATRRDTLLRLELPAALPYLLAGLRVGATLSMVGALAGEFLSADRGLGFFINQAMGAYDTALVMAGVLAVVALALGLYGALRALEQALPGGGRV